MARTRRSIHGQAGSPIKNKEIKGTDLFNIPTLPFYRCQKLSYVVAWTSN